MIERNDIPFGFTYNERGNLITRKNSDGFWREYTRDHKGNILTYKDSDGNWYEYTRDEKGNLLSVKDNLSQWDCIAQDTSYELTIEVNTGEIRAGCRSFATVGEALEHWNRNDARAKLFTAALKKTL